MATRWRCPPDSSPGLRSSAEAGRATRSRSSAACWRRLAAVADAERPQRIGDHLADREAGVQRRVGVLVHELHPAAQLAQRPSAAAS